MLCSGLMYFARHKYSLKHGFVIIKFYDLCFDLRNMKIIDLTLPIHEGMKVYPGDPEVE